MMLLFMFAPVREPNSRVPGVLVPAQFWPIRRFAPSVRASPTTVSVPPPEM
jgi:hypothetical protein